MIYERSYIPPYPIHPWKSLERMLEWEGMSQKELSLRIGITEKHISNIIRGKSSITPDMSLKLEKVFGVTSDFWNNLEISYQQDVSRLEEEEQLQNEISLVDNFICYNELCSLWFVKKVSSKMEKLKNLLNFFGVTSLESIKNLMTHLYQPQYNLYRKSNKYEINNESLMSWLRCWELQSKDIEVEEYSKKKLDKVIEELKEITKNPNPNLDKIQSLLSSCGIICSFTPSFKKVSVNGVSKKLNNKPFIQISDRNKRLHSFWFSLFHEISHIILHLSKKDDLFINFDDKEDKVEEEANSLGSNLLIDDKKFEEFVNEGDFSPHSINSFSKKMGIGSCITAWRLGFVGKIDWSFVSKFDSKFEIKR